MERLDRLPPIEVRVDLPKRTLPVYGYLDGVLLVCRRQVRWLCSEVRRLFHVRLQLVVQVGCWVL